MKPFRTLFTAILIGTMLVGCSISLTSPPPKTETSYVDLLIAHRDFDKVVTASDAWVKLALSIIADLEAELKFARVAADGKAIQLTARDLQAIKRALKNGTTYKLGG